MLTIESMCKVTFWCLWAEGVVSLRKKDSGLVQLQSLVKKDPGLDSLKLKIFVAARCGKPEL